MGPEPKRAPSPAGLEAQAEGSWDRSLPLVTCTHPAATCSPDRLLAFLLPKLDSGSERTRVGSLQVLRHIINSAGE